MGQIQMLLLVGAIIAFSLFNLTVMRQNVIIMEIKYGDIVLLDMYSVSKKLNEYHDTTGTYIGFIISGWIESTPFGNISLTITQDETIMTGNILINGREVIAQVTPEGYIIL